MPGGYPVYLEHLDGDVVVRSRDFPELLTFGSTEEEALREAEDALEVVLLTYVEQDLPIPEYRQPGASEHSVFPRAQVAAKLAIWRQFKGSGLTRVALAKRMGVAESEVRRILDPNHGTRLEKLDAAGRALGLRLVVLSEAA